MIALPRVPPSLRHCNVWDVASCTCGGENEGPQRVATPLEVKPELQQGNEGGGHYYNQLEIPQRHREGNG